MTIAFPARTCRYYCRGVCVYLETINPGLERALRCPVLDGMIADWDSFLDRAELFGLSETLAARIWNGRKHGKAGEHAGCPYGKLPLPVIHAGVAECMYRFGDACLLAMPACGGRCEHFAGPQYS